MLRKLASSIVALAIMGMAGAANASIISFDLSISGDPQMATRENYSLTNTSSALITAISLTIGSAGHTYDCVADPVAPLGGTFLVVSPDTNCSDPLGSGQSSSFQITFTSFDPGDSAMWTADIDPNSGPNDWREVLANSLVSVTFDDGGMVRDLAGRFGAGPITSTETFNFLLPQSMSSVPEPSAFMAFVIGLAGLGVLSRRRKKQPVAAGQFSGI